VFILDALEGDHWGLLVGICRQTWSLSRGGNRIAVVLQKDPAIAPVAELLSSTKPTKERITLFVPTDAALAAFKADQAELPGVRGLTLLSQAFFSCHILSCSLRFWPPDQGIL
jgi:hypothetical protein